MPFINTKVSNSISKEQEEKLRSEFGNAITLLGKTENWLMLEFTDNCRLHFKGNNNEPSAFIDIQLLGKAGGSSYDKMTEKVTALVSDILNIPSDRIYIKYEEVDTWGWNGGNF